MRRFAFYVAVLTFVSPLWAQTPYGRMTGRVTDAADAVIVGASVRAVQQETNISTRTTTTPQGVYDLLNLLPGTYRLEVEAPGFKRFQRGPLEVRVGDLLAMDVFLEVGAQTETVHVTAEAPLLESGTASLGQTIENRQITDLPLANRGISYLMQLSPGVISTNAPTHGWLPQARGSVSDIATLGARTRSSEFTLDGIPNMEQGGVIAFQPPPEMVQEFRIQTAAFDASVGHFTGSHVNMVLKSGSNDYHGSLWFSHLSRPLMTHPFFINRELHDLSTGPPTAEKRSGLWPATKTNRYRATVGGPVRIPKLYDGRNRTFFTYGNDFMLRTFAGTAFSTVPTAAQRRGDFSDLLRLDSQYQIYDPATIAPAPNGRFSRQPLAGNRVPAARLDPVAVKILSFFPLPNRAGTADGRNNYLGTPQSRIDYAAHVVRVDQVINERQRMYGSFSRSSIQGDQGRILNNHARGSLTDSGYTSVVLDDVLTLRPNLVANFRYGLTRFRSQAQPTSAGLDMAGLGLSPRLLSALDPDLRALPTVNIEGYTALNTQEFTNTATNYHFLAGSAKWVRGAHSLGFGLEYRVLQENAYDYGLAVPSYDFDSIWTRGPEDISTGAPIGQGLAAFLMGLPSGGFIDRNPSYAEQSSYLGVFIHDDWKITRRLTLNLGLRYEYEVPTTERFDRTNRGFDFTTPNPITEAARTHYGQNPIPQVPVDQFRTPGGLLFANTGGTARGLWGPDRNNFSPRIGLAWRARPEMVVRAGYGVFFESLGADRIDVAQQGFSQRTSLVPSLDNGLSFRATLANPFPDGRLDPAGAAGGLRTFIGRAPSFFTPARRTGYMPRWTLNLQRQLPGRAMVEVGYTGNRGTRLGVGKDYNAVPAPYLSRSAARDQATINFLTQATANPFFGIPGFEGSPLGVRNVQRAQLLRPFPHFTAVNTTLSEGFSWYHSGHARLEKRYSRGLSLSASYTWSKFMEAVERLNLQDLHPHHVVSPQDRPHHIALSGMYELPFGPGRRWEFGPGARWLNHVAGGWSVQWIYQWQSGAPIALGNVLLRGRLEDLVLPRGERRVERWFNVDAGLERLPANQLANNLRTFPLRLTGLRADNWNNWDISLFKTFRLREALRLQLRAEAQDALNHAMFQAPNAVPANTLFGTVNATIWTEQRKITMAAKLVW